MELKQRSRILAKFLKLVVQKSKVDLDLSELENFDSNDGIGSERLTFLACPPLRDPVFIKLWFQSIYQKKNSL